MRCRQKHFDAFKKQFRHVKDINWFPGHMATAKKDIYNWVNSVDVIVEVRDARIPFSSESSLLDEIGRHKKRLVVFNKADLCNSNLNKRICDRLAEKGHDSLFTSAKKGSRISNILQWCIKNSNSQFKNTGGSIMLVIGHPNVGKSSILNSLRRLSTSGKISSGRTRAVVGAEPGVTRRTDIVKVNNRPALYVVDTPGIFIPKVPNAYAGLQFALVGAIKDKIVGVDIIAEFLLFRLNQEKLHVYVQRFGLSQPMDSIDSLLDVLVVPSGGSGKDTVTQRKLAAEYFLSKFREGSLGKLTLDLIS